MKAVTASKNRVFMGMGIWWAEWQRGVHLLDVGQSDGDNQQPETMLDRPVRVKVSQSSVTVIHRKASSHRETGGRMEYDVRTLTPHCCLDLVSDLFGRRFCVGLRLLLYTP